MYTRFPSCQQNAVPNGRARYLQTKRLAFCEISNLEVCVIINAQMKTNIAENCR